MKKNSQNHTLGNLKKISEKGNNKSIIIENLRKIQMFEISEGEKKNLIVFLSDVPKKTGSLQVLIKGPKAKVQILGIVIGTGGEEISFSTWQNHLVGGSMSDLLIKAVLFDRARFHYQGLIRIEKGAQNSNAYQKNQTLLVSPRASVDSRPFLEILANQVRCTHGATVGKIDSEQLFYLKTRGLSEKAASRLIIEGFLKEVIERIPEGEIQERLRKKIAEKIVEIFKEKKFEKEKFYA